MEQNTADVMNNISLIAKELSETMKDSCTSNFRIIKYLIIVLAVSVLCNLATVVYFINSIYGYEYKVENKNVNENKSTIERGVE